MFKEFKSREKQIMVKKIIKKKPLKPQKFSVVVYRGNKIKTKSFKSRKCAHKYVLKNQCKSTLKKPIQAKTKLIK
jgi:hypothetical protein